MKKCTETWTTHVDSRTCSKPTKITARDIAQAQKAVKDATGYLPNVLCMSSGVYIDLLHAVMKGYERALRKIARMGGKAGRIAKEALK